MDNHPSSNSIFDKPSLRREMRRKRRALSPRQQKQAAQKLKSTLTLSPLFNRSKHTAIYLPNDGEIDPTRFISMLWKSKKRCYLPVLHPTKKNCLWFYHYTPKTILKKNRFGIPEPSIKNKTRISPWALNLVLFPLVAFDKQGGRLGMGGGFYDRTFEFTRTRKLGEMGTRTQLYGLAHHFQKVEALPVERWDVPLHGIATEKQLFFTRQKQH
ncbi:5-formyltetrahydrofolate cyclo-ligase [Alkalimarinus sediminis]|uniref:5-formyltetrahydrofolate cyclo-ligase n=1 Tax=Alkalimarinus sediminis TaxID=1632866 RepID=A0A9E8HJ71_9ALTE|nr:5-formyltetrahydrofolate cyclo-ligase [Alkalimarinus sediminis]UZW74337.1 5-formyltetrahydrofolate cyclo-ligase [Alkalimarinus sediminis]